MLVASRVRPDPLGTGVEWTTEQIVDCLYRAVVEVDAELATLKAEQAEIDRAIRREADCGAAVLSATHDPEVIRGADRVIRLDAVNPFGALPAGGCRPPCSCRRCE